MTGDTPTSATTDETAQPPTTQDYMDAALAAKGDGDGERGWQDGILDEYISPEQLALELNISTRTLDRWHSVREGPPRTRLGKRILYR